MRILAIHSSKGKAGATMNLGFIAKAMTQKGHEFIVLYRREDNGSRHLQNCGARLILNDFPLGMNTTTILESSHAPLGKVLLQNLKDPIKFLVGIIITIWYLHKTKPDAVFLMDITYPQVAIVCFLLGIPTVCQVQAEVMKGHFGLRRWIIVKIINGCDRVFGITSRHFEPFNRTKRPRYGPKVIPNTIDLLEDESLSRAVTQMLDALRIASSAKVVTYFGGDIQFKGYEQVLRLIDQTADKRDDVSFILAGTFRRPCRLNRPNMRVVGDEFDSMLLMKASSVILVPHKFPHFSRVIVEAFSMARVVIATNDSFNDQIIKDGYNGYLVDYDDAKSWAEKLESVIDNGDLASDIGSRAYATYLSSFNPSVIREQITDMFESCVMGPSGHYTC